jgi:hypothetical protein
VDDFEVVEPVFQQIFATVWHEGAEDSRALESLSALDRAVYATRVIEGELDNGGWYQAFGNGVDHLIEHAMSGYELLGLADYAGHLRDVHASGFTAVSPDELGTALDQAYFRLSGSELARADLIRAMDLARQRSG